MPLFSQDWLAAVSAVVRVLQNARSPVAGGNVGDVEPDVAIGVPPLEFDDLFVAEVGDQVEYMMRDNENRRGSSLAAGLARDGA